MVEDYPRTLLELEQRFGAEAACRQYLYLSALAGGFCMSALRWPRGLAAQCGVVAVCILSFSYLRHCRHDLPRPQTASDALVPGPVADDPSNERQECLGLATGVGAGQL